MLKLSLLLKVLLTFSLLSLFVSNTYAVMPAYRYNLTRQGVSEFALTSTSPIRWISPNIGANTASPVVDKQGNIYIPVLNRGLIKLNSSGEILWTFPSWNVIAGSPTFDDDQNIYFSVAGCNPYVYSLDPNGAIRWKYDLRQNSGQCGYNQSTGAATLSADKQTLYVAVNYPLQSILAFSLDGTLKWQRRLIGEQHGISSIAIASDNTLYIGTSPRGFLSALFPDGSVRWSQYTVWGPTITVGTPIVGSDNNIYVIGSGGRGGDALLSFTNSGAPRWSYQLPSQLLKAVPTQYQQTIYLAENNNLHAINTADGTLKWKWTAPLGPVSSPTVDKNGAIYTTAGNSVYAVSPEGITTSSLELGFELRELIIADNGLIYVPRHQPYSRDGYLYAIGSYQTPPTAYPVIFIPGIGGSEFKATQDIIWSKDDGHGGTYSHAYEEGEKIWVNSWEAAMPGNDDYFDVLRLKPDGKTSEADLSLTGELTEFGYSEINSFFQNIGYEKNRTFFVYPYDWRKDIKETEEELDRLVELAQQKSGVGKVNIVAHSMGGLVARNYIGNPKKAKKVNKLISMGVPHLGAVDALKTFMYGSWLGYDFYLFHLGIPPSQTKDLAQNMSSIVELLPSSEYFNFYNNSHPTLIYPFRDDRNVDNNKVTGNLDFIQIKNLLSNLKYSMTIFDIAEQFQTSLISMLNMNNGVKLYHIVGSGQPTLGQIKEDWLIDWPIKLIPRMEEIYINGDDTVPLYSASLKSDDRDLSAGARIYYVEQEHGDLVKNDGAGMKLVKAILNEVDEIPTEVRSQKITLEGQQISVDNDADIDLFDEEGRHTGLKQDQEIENNIPETFFNVSGKSKHIFIKKKAKKVKVKITPKNKGKINTNIRHYQEDKISKNILYKDIPVQETSKIEFEIEPGSDTTVKLTAADTIISPTSEVVGEQAFDQTPPQTIIQTSGDKDSSGNFTSPVTVTLTAADSGSGVLYLEYSLDNGQTIHTYTEPFIISNSGTTVLQVKAIDKTGNEEYPQTFTITISPLASPSPTSQATPTFTPSPTPNQDGSGQAPSSTPTPTVTEPSPTPTPTITTTFTTSLNSLNNIYSNITNNIPALPSAVNTFDSAASPITTPDSVLGISLKNPLSASISGILATTPEDKNESTLKDQPTNSPKDQQDSFYSWYLAVSVLPLGLALLLKQLLGTSGFKLTFRKHSQK